MRRSFALACLLGASCGNTRIAADATPIDAVTAADATPDVPGALVPDPGTGPMPADWPDTEPNDSPDRAVPLGVAPAVQIGPYVGHGHLGGGDEADYFVFRSNHAMTTMIAGATWPLQVDLLDFALYKVVDGQPPIPVAASHATTLGGEFPSPPWQIALEPDTKYLFAILHVTGESDYCS